MKRELRAAIDTNLFISGLFARDALSAQLQNLWINQQFELVVYVDDVMLTEAEQGHVPFNWPWNTTTISPGEHWLTVNLVTMRNHVGTATRRVKIVRESQTQPAATQPGKPPAETRPAEKG